MPRTKTAQKYVSLNTFKDYHKRVTLVENWLRKPGLNADINSATESVREIANPDFEILGTNADSSCSALSTGGGITLTTKTTANDQVILLPHLDTNQTAWSVIDWSTDDQVAFNALIKTGPSVADVTIWCGLKLTNTPVVATDNDQAFFRYQDSQGGGHWQCVYSVNGTDYIVDTDVAVNASESYDLMIEIDAQRKVSFTINGEVVHKSTVALKTGVDLIPYTGVMTGTAAAKSLTVRPGYAISKNQND